MHQVAGIGRRFGGVDGKARQTAFLCALDLAIPISTFDETHSHAPASTPRDLRDPAPALAVLERQDLLMRPVKVKRHVRYLLIEPL